jgi:hypothetical protein
LTDRERFLNVMSYQPVDRCVYGVMTGPWPETVERWKTEGFDPANPPVFNTDRWAWHGGWFFPNPPFERKVIEETETTILYINHEGILMRERKDQPYSSMPQFVKFPTETREQFRRFYKERMQPDLAARIGSGYAEQLASYRDRDYPMAVVSDRWGGMFGGLRNLVGVEKLCTLFYDDPAFVEEMMDAVADFIIAMMGQILDHTDIDVYGFWEDMAYKTGPLIGPDMLRKYALPRYKRVVDFVRSRGVKHVSLDSDGDISSLIPVWLDAGIDILYPFEVQCGMDVVAVRREYGRQLKMWGGINKHALAVSTQAIDAELQRVRPLVEEGGYVPALDHSMPPDTPYANYLYYMDKLWEIM